MLLLRCSIPGRTRSQRADLVCMCVSSCPCPCPPPPLPATQILPLHRAALVCQRVWRAHRYGSLAAERLRRAVFQYWLWSKAAVIIQTLWRGKVGTRRRGRADGAVTGQRGLRRDVGTGGDVVAAKRLRCPQSGPPDSCYGTQLREDAWMATTPDISPVCFVLLTRRRPASAARGCGCSSARRASWRPSAARPRRRTCSGCRCGPHPTRHGAG